MSYTRAVLFGANTKRMVAHFITSSQMHYSNNIIITPRVMKKKSYLNNHYDYILVTSYVYKPRPYDIFSRDC